MLLVLTFFAVVAVAALGMMARRYGSIIEGQREARARAERRIAAPRDAERPSTAPTAAEAAALARVDAFVRARNARDAAGDVSDVALAECGLDRAGYEALEAQLVDWKSGGGEVPVALRRAFGLRRTELTDAEP